MVSGLKFVANGDVDPCPPHVLLNDGTDTSGSGTAGHIFLTVLPPVSGEVVCEFFAFGIRGCCGPVSLVLFFAVRESLLPLDVSPPLLLEGFFGLSYSSLLSAKGFSYPGFQSGKREWHWHGVMLRSFEPPRVRQCVQSSVFLLMLSCMAFREQTGIPPLAGRDVGSRSIRSTKIEPQNKPPRLQTPVSTRCIEEVIDVRDFGTMAQRDTTSRSLDYCR